MTLPAPITRQTSYTAFAQALGDGSLPGSQLDIDFDQTNNAVDQLVAAVRAVLRDDGVLANGSVPRSALAADVMLGLGASRPWQSTTLYAVNATVTRGYGLYVAIAASVGSDPAVSPTKWALQADLSQAVVIAPGSVTTEALPAKSVTEPKLADGAVSTRVLGAKAVTRDKVADKIGLVPVGGEMDYAGWNPPAGWLFCAGQAVSRTDYPDLYAALSLGFLADTAAGSTTLSNVSAPITGIGLRNAVVEGPGIPAGAVLSSDASGAVTLSTAATASGSQVAIRLFPYGRGDGSTTFNLPDRRGRVTAARDNMGGAATGRTTTFDATGLSGVGGIDKFSLANAHLPAALPAASVTVAFPSLGYRKSKELNQQFFNGTSSGGVVTVNAGADDVQTNAGGQQNFSVSQPNPGGGANLSLLQPTGTANRIIFAGV